jgi:hypothetical protein
MADPLSIRNVVELVTRGQLRIPAFQRGFVWDANQVAFLMDSIYKRYPFGSILLWRTKEPLRSEKTLGPFELPKGDPDYPVDYILDGQQRITSIFGVFQTELNPVASTPWTEIYYDFQVDPRVQESQFVALTSEQVEKDRHFPLRSLFDTVQYRKATQGLSDDTLKRIDEMQAVFKEVRIPVQLIQTEDRATVAIIFERVNRSGVPLDTLQLLSAWTWSEEFTLHEEFAELSAELEPFGFKEVGGDTDLLLRCCAAIFTSDASPNSLINLSGAVVRDRFQEVSNGIKGAIDFLRDNAKVHALDNLPFSAVLVPLSVFFAVPGNEHARYSDEQRRALLKWFWRSCFSKRYSSGVLRNLKTDIDEIIKLKNRQPNQLGAFTVNIDKTFFLKNQFRIGSVNTKTFILLLAQSNPRSFVSGAPVTLRDVLRDCNRNEFHHLCPRAFLEGKDTSNDPGALANFCFLSRVDNGHLGGAAPSSYRTKMPSNVDEILNSSLCPPSLFADDYDAFAEERAAKLAEEANKLL